MEQWSMLSSLAYSSLEVDCSYRLKFFAAKNHLKTNCSLLDSRLLDDVQHALLKTLSTERVWHYACAMHAVRRLIRSKVHPKIKYACYGSYTANSASIFGNPY